MNISHYIKLKVLYSAIFLAGLFSIGNVQASSINVLGNISANQTWAFDTVKVIGDVTVNNNIKLTINPGTLVLFMGHFRITVAGSIHAVGTGSYPIRFTVNDTTGFYNLSNPNGGWYGIRFDSTLAGNDTSYLKYCEFTYGKASGSSKDANGGAILIYYFSKVVVANCSFVSNLAKTNGGAIYIRKSRPVILFNTFARNKAASGGGIYISSGSPFVYNNDFHLNFAGNGGGGVFCADTTTATVNNNLIYGNMGLLGGGISCYVSNPEVNNNTIVYNKATHGGAMSCITSGPNLRNNILYYNTGSGTGPQVSLLNAGSNPNFYYCDIQGGQSGFGGGGAASYSGTYQNNLAADPRFQDTLANDYLIRGNSPCLDAGTPDTTGLHLYNFDVIGNPRISMNRVDIGALERQQVVSFCGNISQNTSWIADTVKVNCDITIANGVRLTIVPGVYVEFQDTFKIVVKGTLMAMGATGDSITFSCHDWMNGWRGIQFDTIDAANDSSYFSYCIFTGAKNLSGKGGAMRFNSSSKVCISNCVFAYNFSFDGGAVHMSASSPLIKNSILKNNNADFSFGKGGALYCSRNSSPVLAHIKVMHNQSSQGGGIYCEKSPVLISNAMIANNFSFNGGGICLDSSDMVLMNSVIVNNQALNQAGGLWLNGSSPKITNNTIANNIGTGGAAFVKASSPVFTNCILYSDYESLVSKNEVCISDTLSLPEFHYCNIEGDTSSFIYDTAFGLNALFTANIDTTPGFKNPSTGAGSGYEGSSADWSLDACSFMYNKGKPDTSGLDLPLYDFGDNQRIHADTVDIGAYELIKPYIVVQPGNTAVCAGADVIFSVGIESSITLAYQWQEKPAGAPAFVNCTDSTSNTAAFFIAGVVDSMDSYQYRCIIMANCSQLIITVTATLSVYTAPAITAEPIDVSVCQGSAANFSLTASGSGVAYQWQQRPFGSATWSNCAGASASTASYSIPNVPLSLNNYNYRCIVYGTCSPEDTSMVVSLTVKGLPAVVTQPANVSICAGNNATFTVTGSGSGIAYQWQESVNGGISWSNLVGSTGPSLTFTGVTAIMNGFKYRCIITGDCTPPATSNAATLTVNSPPNVTTQPADANVCVNSSVNITINVTGGNLAYQWQQKPPASVWANAPGLSALTNTYQIVNVPFSMDGYKFRCMITGSCPPPKITDSVTLHVHNLPSLYIGADTSLPLSGTIMLDAGPGYTGYQWSTSESTQTINVVGTVAGVGIHQYTCTVTDANGCQNSDALLVTVYDDTGIESFGNDGPISVWPNPANEKINIRFDGILPERLKIQLLDLIGAKITEIIYNAVPAAAISIPLGNIRNGIYYLKIETAAVTTVREINILR